jgi:hypothetical protein
MGFLTNMFSAAVKVALTPVAVASDVVKTAVGVEPDTTKGLLKMAKDDAEEAMDDLCGEGDGFL